MDVISAVAASDGWGLEGERKVIGKVALKSDIICQRHLVGQE